MKVEWRIVKSNNLPRSRSGTTRGGLLRLFSNWISSEESTVESPCEDGTILLILTVWHAGLGVGHPPHSSRKTCVLGSETLAAADSRVLGQRECSGVGGQWQEPHGRLHGGHAWVVPGNPQRYISGEGVFKGDARRQRTRHPVKNQRCGQCSWGHHARLCQPEKQKVTRGHHPFKGGGTCVSFFANTTGRNCKRGGVSGIWEPDYAPFSPSVSTLITYIKIFGIFCEFARL